MNKSNTQTPKALFAIAKSTTVKPNTGESKMLTQVISEITSEITNEIISAKLIGSQSLNDLIANAVSSQEVKDFHLGLIMIGNLLGNIQLLDPDEDDEDDEDEEDEEGEDHEEE